MIELSLIPVTVLKAAAQNLGWGDMPLMSENEISSTEIPQEYIEQLEKKSPKELFECYCEWHGLLGWSNTLWETVQVLHGAEYV